MCVPAPQDPEELWKAIYCYSLLGGISHYHLEKSRSIMLEKQSPMVHKKLTYREWRKERKIQNNVEETKSRWQPLSSDIVLNLPKQTRTMLSKQFFLRKRTYLKVARRVRPRVRENISQTLAPNCWKKHWVWRWVPRFLSLSATYYLYDIGHDLSRSWKTWMEGIYRFFSISNTHTYGRHIKGHKIQ